MASGAGETVVHVESAQPAPVTGATPSAPSTPANPAGGGALGNTPGHSHAASDLVVEEALEARPELPGTESLLRLVGQVDATKSPAADGAAGSNPGGAPGDAQGGDVAVDTTLSKAGQVLSRREILQKKGGFSEAKLAAEAAEAAQTAAHEAEQALAIAQAAAATAAAVEEEDDGLTLRSTAVEEIKDEESGAGVEEVRAVVPLTKTKHTLSFRFLGREMLEGKSFQDPDRAAVCNVVVVVCRCVVPGACWADVGVIFLHWSTYACACNHITSHRITCTGAGALSHASISARQGLVVHTQQGLGSTWCWRQPVLEPPVLFGRADASAQRVGGAHFPAGNGRVTHSRRRHGSHGLGKVHAWQQWCVVSPLFFVVSSPVCVSAKRWRLGLLGGPCVDVLPYHMRTRVFELDNACIVHRVCGSRNEHQRHGCDAQCHGGYHGGA